MPTYRLTHAAAEDVEEIFIVGVALLGLAQAESYHKGLTQAFDFRAEFPRAARVREEIQPPVRAFRYKAHIIVYDVADDDSILIVRVRHGREDWLPMERGGERQSA